MATSLGSLSVDLNLQSAQFMAQMKAAATQTQATGRQISSALSGATSFAKGALGGLAGVLTVDFLASAAKSAFDYADAIVDLADRTGATTKTIQEFRYAAQLSGSSVESADAAVEKFSKNLGAAQNGNKAMAKTFHDLGVSSTDTDTALKQTMDGISKLGAVTARNQKTTEIFGKSAADMTALMSGGAKGYSELANAANNYGIVIEDEVLRNAGTVNDRLDQLKLIVDAKMANAFVQNADSIALMVDQLIKLASAAGDAFSALSNLNAKQGVMNEGLTKWLLTPIGGKSSDHGWGLPSADEAIKSNRAALQGNRDGRNWLYKHNADEMNDIYKSGDRSVEARTRWSNLKRENADILARELRARNPVSTKPNSPKLPTPTSTPTKSKTGPTLKTDAELEDAWQRDFLRARSSLYGAQAQLTPDVSEKADFAAKQARNSYFSRISDIDEDTGTDAQIREGKKRYTEAQAKQLRAIEKETFDADYDKIIQERDQALAEQRLAVSQSALANELGLLNGDEALARSSSERRAIALRQIDAQHKQEKLALEAVVASKTATDAEKEIAQARLNILDKLKGKADEKARRDTAGPLEQYLTAIPKTASEVNDQMGQFEADGLSKLEDGLLGVFHGTETVTGALKGLFGTVLDGLEKIAIQQAIIKPLGSLLFGGGEEGSGGGLLGGILGGIVKGTVKGARANGGMTQPGTYLVGERGPELATIGAPANVMTNTTLNAVQGNARSTGPTININGPITSNDPAMVRVMIMEGVMSAVPMITRQSTDATLKRLNRRTL